MTDFTLGQSTDTKKIEAVYENGRLVTGYTEENQNAIKFGVGTIMIDSNNGSKTFERYPTAPTSNYTIIWKDQYDNFNVEQLKVSVKY